MYISRSEAERKYRISTPRLRQLEKKGKLVAIDASTVPYNPPQKTRGGSAVKVVYEEAQVAHFGKKRANKRFAPRVCIAPLVFDMLAAGSDVTDIVIQLRVDLDTVQRLRDTYVREKGGIWIPGTLVQALRDLGFDPRPDNFVEVVRGLLELHLTLTIAVWLLELERPA
jgi:hypothetical protein